MKIHIMVLWTVFKIKKIKKTKEKEKKGLMQFLQCMKTESYATIFYFLFF
jgi:hypothetical protein